MQTITDAELKAFIAESNAIENIDRAPTAIEILAHLDFLKTPPSVRTLQRFVLLVANAELRAKRGMDVVVGKHIPPPGGDWVPISLGDHILVGVTTPHERHLEYEDLHPFMDGNGRSGRALWLHNMLEIDAYVPRFKFLRMFYYQTLQESR